MTDYSDRALCVVLNNQHGDRVDEFLEINSADAGRNVLFQPYTDVHMRAVRDLLDHSGQPVPLFLVVGRFGESVCAIGLLRSIEYTDEMTPDRKSELAQWASKYDNPPVYALNILSASNLVRLRQPIPLERFVKHSDDTPLAAGSWTASICYTSDLAEVLDAI